MSGSAKVTYGFVSFTEVEAGEHRSYNEWHLFDHMPEQFPLNGIVFGQRWVLTPALRAHMRAEAPLDRIHYVTLYLLAEPIEATLLTFQQLAVELRNAGRFHEHRTSHLSGPVRLEEMTAAPHALVRPEAIPYRPHRGVHVRIGTDHPSIDTPGVAGTWSFHGDGHAPAPLVFETLSWSWLDGDPNALAAPLSSSDAAFSATFDLVPQFGPWDWFD